MKVQQKWCEREDGCWQVLSSFSVHLNQVPENGSRHFNATLTYLVCTVNKLETTFVLPPCGTGRPQLNRPGHIPSQDKSSPVLLICVQFFWGGQEWRQKPWSPLKALSHCWKAGQTTWQVQSLLLLISSVLQKSWFTAVNEFLHIPEYHNKSLHLLLPMYGTF